MWANKMLKKPEKEDFRKYGPPSKAVSDAQLIEARVDGLHSNLEDTLRRSLSGELVSTKYRAKAAKVPGKRSK